MRQVDGVTYVTIGEAGRAIGRGVQTIKNWYEYQDTGASIKLPEIITGLDRRGTRYFREDDVKLLAAFRDTVTYGMMSEVSRNKWGERGRDIVERQQAQQEQPETPSQQAQ